MLFRQSARRADSRTCWTAGSNNPTRMPIMAITTRSSTSVKTCASNWIASHLKPSQSGCESQATTGGVNDLPLRYLLPCIRSTHGRAQWTPNPRQNVDLLPRCGICTSIYRLHAVTPIALMARPGFCISPEQAVGFAEFTCFQPCRDFIDLPHIRRHVPSTLVNGHSGIPASHHSG